jgi:hypothetical protein
MATVIHRNSDTFHGIWLLDDVALKVLDDIIDKEWGNLQEIRKNKIKDLAIQQYSKFGDKNKVTLEEIERQISEPYPFSKNSRSITLSFKSGKKLKSASFREAKENPEVQDQIPNGFSIEMKTETIDCEMQLQENRLSIRVSPELVEEASTIFLKLEQWAMQFRSPKWMYLWKNNNGFLQLLVTLFLLTIMFTSAIRYSNPVETNLIIQARDLLKDGISQKEVPKALEMVLSLLTLSNEGKVYYVKPWFWSFVAIYLPALLISFFPPNSILVIGKGTKILKRQKAWLKFVCVMIPTFLIMGVAASVFGSVIVELVKRAFLS